MDALAAFGAASPSGVLPLSAQCTALEAHAAPPGASRCANARRRSAPHAAIAPEVDVGTEQRVQAPQHVEVEGSRHAKHVVVGGFEQHTRVLHEVGAGR
ncbi:MAG: hypothetical protein U1F49_07970 [Rubrivivax sp.]